ncbi:MAG: tetratricopeptide repeat protein [Candidatus Omnitrophota bacterium]
MKKFQATKKEKNIFFFIVVIIFFYLSFLIYSDLKAHFFYKKARAYVKPVQKIGKIEYYRKKIFALKKALSLVKDRAKYYLYYGKTVSSAIEDNLGSKLNVDKEVAESLYKEAIKLNPSNFLYHFELGRFYKKHGDKRAKKQLLKVYQIYPTYSARDIKLDLASLYFQQVQSYLNKSNASAAFKNLLLFVYYRKKPKGWGKYYNVLKEISKIAEDINRVKSLKVNVKEKKLEYVTSADFNGFNFKTEEFPHIQINLVFKVYILDSEDKVFLYKGYEPYQQFQYVGREKDFYVYQYSLENYPEDIYLDDFKIKTKFYSPLERIEIIKKFKN